MERLGTRGCLDPLPRAGAGIGVGAQCGGTGTRPTARAKDALALIADCILRAIDSDDADANRRAAAAFELCDLPDEVGLHAVDLLDHCFCENFHLGADLDGRGLATLISHLGSSERIMQGEMIVMEI